MRRIEITFVFQESTMLHLFSTLQILALDPSLGRVDIASLTDQQCMELLMAGCSEGCQEEYKSKEGEFFDVCDWVDITCDSEGRVAEIENLAADGTLPLQYLPRCVTRCKIACANFQGTIDTHGLPDTLEKLIVHLNRMSGSVDMRTLPPHLIRFDVFSNELSGSLDLTNLPITLEKIDVSENNFTGSLALHKLPPSMRILLAGYNHLSGELCLDRLPSAFAVLELEKNSISGSLVFLNPPESLRMLSLRDNSLSGTAVILSSVSESAVSLEGNDICSILDEDGHKHSICIED